MRRRNRRGVSCGMGEEAGKVTLSAASANSRHIHGIWAALSNIEPQRVSSSIPPSIARDEAFFWSRNWQQGELESQSERDAGNVVTFENRKELLRWLLSAED
jgi:hypothetical protein